MVHSSLQRRARAGHCGGLWTHHQSQHGGYDADRHRTGVSQRGACCSRSPSSYPPYPRLHSARPAHPRSKPSRPRRRSAQAELERMNAELEVQVEEYNAITESLEQTREEIRVTAGANSSAPEQDLAEAQRTLSERATSIYKGGSTSMLDVFLGARSFDDFVTLLDLAVRINRSDAEMVAEVKEAKAASRPPRSRSSSDRPSRWRSSPKRARARRASRPM